MKWSEVIRKAKRRDAGELTREAFKRARAALRWELLLGGYAHAPYAVSFWLTRRCNYRCQMCWVASSHLQEGAAYIRPDEEMTLVELRRVVDDIAGWRPRVGVTGGEPFLRRDCLDFLAYVKSRRLRASVNTNGAFLSRDADDIVAVGVDGVMVSVDGPAAVHDAQRRAPGAFEQALAGIEALAAAKARRGADRPYLKVTCTVTNDNLSRLAATASLFQDVPLDEFTFQHLWFTDQATADAQRNLFSRIFGQDTTYLQGFVVPATPPLDVAALRHAREEVRGLRLPFPVRFYPPLRDDEVLPFYSYPHHRLRRRCFSRWLRLDITPWGEVTPCLGLVVGDVRRQPLTQIWNDAPYRRFRRELARRRLFPGCNRCCGLFSD